MVARRPEGIGRGRGLLFLLLFATCLSGVSGKLLPGLSESELVERADLILTAKLTSEPARQETSALLVFTVTTLLKGTWQQPTLRVEFLLAPPCTPDRIQPVPAELQAGSEFLLFLDQNEEQPECPMNILDQWQGQGIRPHDPVLEERVRRLIASPAPTLIPTPPASAPR